MSDSNLLPLSGVRIVDFTRHMAGPYATVFLSDYGADVIKVESVPDGDPSRGTGDNDSGLFLIWNRGKRSIALDLRQKTCIELIRRLVRTADVIVENWKPGTAEAIGIGYEDLKNENPGLIYLSISAFGRGPLDPNPGTDPVVQAMSGVMSVTGERDGPPILVGVPMADFTSAMISVQAVTLGLLARAKTGHGQKIELSMLHAMITSLTTRLAGYWSSGKEPERHGGAHSVTFPYQVWQTSDGYVVAGVWMGAEHMWPVFCNTLGVDALGSDPRYALGPVRLQLRTELEPAIQEAFRKHTSEHWEIEFRKNKLLFSPVYTFGQILDHPHTLQAGIVGSVDHPTQGKIPQITPPIVMSETPGGISRPPPLLGEHTREVLKELGCTDNEIDALVRNKMALAPDASE